MEVAERKAPESRSHVIIRGLGKNLDDLTQLSICLSGELEPSTAGCEPQTRIGRGLPTFQPVAHSLLCGDLDPGSLQVVQPSSSIA